jgi:hypothetical protein
MSGVGPSGVYRLMGLARRKALLMPVLSAAALVVSAVEGASGWILVWLAVFLGALVVVMWRLVNRVDVDGTGNVRFHRGLAGAVAVHVDEIREVRRTTWGFNVARVDAADEAVFVDLGSSSQFDELLAVLQGLRTVGPFPVEGVRRRVRPSPDATFDSSDAQR